MADAVYKVKNWNEYNQALKKRGSLTLWLDAEMVEKWNKLSPYE